MKLLRHIALHAPGLLVFTALAALVSGACNAGLIALVNKALNNPLASLSSLVPVFIALAAGKVLSGAISSLVVTRYSEATIVNLREGLIRRFLTIPLRRIEEIGSAQILAVLTEDVMHLTQALLAIPLFTVNVAILVCGALYLVWLSWKVLLCIGVLILCGAVAYRLLILAGFHHLTLTREHEDRLFSHFRSLTEGIKELKLHRRRRAAFLTQNVQAAAEACRRHNVAAEARFTLAQAWNQLLVLTVMGLILFALPTWQHISPQALTGYVVTTLYLTGPLAGVMGSLSVYGRANASLAKLEQLGLSLDNASNETCPLNAVSTNGHDSRIQDQWNGDLLTSPAQRLRATNRDVPGLDGRSRQVLSASKIVSSNGNSNNGDRQSAIGTNAVAAANGESANNAKYSDVAVPHSEICNLQSPFPPMHTVELVGITHTYRHEKDDSHFVLGPINLNFHCGEVIFLVGGNGSGKTTLAKIITGLYSPEAGEIRLDGKTIHDQTRDEYRQHFSAVFADFHLFESLLGHQSLTVDKQAHQFLEQLHLQHKVRITDGAFSTTALSQGQRKRLALLTAYMEDRPFYLFDEWASDQDPQFKEIFYSEILPNLRSRGKAVIVITHDDKYFGHADRILKLDYGKLLYDYNGHEHGQDQASENPRPVSRESELELAPLS